MVLITMLVMLMLLFLMLILMFELELDTENHWWKTASIYWYWSCFSWYWCYLLVLLHWQWIVRQFQCTSRDSSILVVSVQAVALLTQVDTPLSPFANWSNDRDTGADKTPFPPNADADMSSKLILSKHQFPCWLTQWPWYGCWQTTFSLQCWCWCWHVLIAVSSGRPANPGGYPLSPFANWSNDRDPGADKTPFPSNADADMSSKLILCKHQFPCWLTQWPWYGCW